ncbi:MAG: hypothetical protein IJT01_01965 [Selenomonadaceae bacterium]|nr:hypothetical protein [Selenomonadaceae bacterium]
MDDYTWQKTLQKRRSSRHRQSFFLFLLLGAIIASAIWYFGIYTRTPEYALQQAMNAIKNNDAASFQQNVNLDLLTSNAYDDLTVDLFAYDSTLTPQTKVLFEKFYVMIKPQLTNGVKEAILNRLDRDAWILPSGIDILKGRQLGIDFERFLERSQLRNTTFVSIGSISHNGATATAELNVVEDYTQTPFTLELVMEESHDGHWQVAYIKNYKDYLNTIAPLQNKDISDYIAATQDIVDNSNREFLQQQQRFKNLTKTSSGVLSEGQKSEIRALLLDEVIPSLKKRQQKLDELPVPPGAFYLARLRQQSTEITIKTWQHYVKALREDKPVEFETAETLHKQQLEIDLRIEDIIKHTAVSKNIPNIP